MASHSKIYPKINGILAEEWRDDIGEIIGELERQKRVKKEFGG
jgi:hypothetical protein